MTTYETLTLPELYDLLAKETKRLSELIANRQFQSDEYLKCSNAIKKIQKIIHQKQESSGSSNKNIQRDSYGFNLGF